MSSTAPYSRIAITLPADDLAAADRLAKQQDLSHSWIVAEALRRYAASFEQGLAQENLDGSRRAQLRRDLTLIPEGRVHAAEDTLLSTEQVTTPRIFATFDHFVASRRADGVFSRESCEQSPRAAVTAADRRASMVSGGWRDGDAALGKHASHA